MPRHIGRYAALALLLVGSAALALATRPGRDGDTGVPAPGALDWEALEMRGAAPPAPGSAFALLYVQASCVHCAAVASLVDSLTAVLAVPAVFITNDSTDTARAFAQSIGLLRPIVRDTGGVIRSRLNVTAVPMLIGYRADGRARVVVGAARPSAVRALLRGLQ